MASDSRLNGLNNLGTRGQLVRERVVGTVLFGYTKNLQNRGGISNYPASSLKVYCATGDMVCTGSLIITAMHFSYFDEAAGPAPKFLQSKIGN